MLSLLAGLWLFPQSQVWRLRPCWLASIISLLQLNPAACGGGARSKLNKPFGEKSLHNVVFCDKVLICKSASLCTEWDKIVLQMEQYCASLCSCLLAPDWITMIMTGFQPGSVVCFCYCWRYQVRSHGVVSLGRSLQVQVTISLGPRDLWLILSPLSKHRRRRNSNLFLRKKQTNSWLPVKANV